MEEERNPVSEKIKKLYKLLIDIECDDDKSAYEYYRWIVRHCDKDFMHLLLLQLEKMNDEYEIHE